MLGMQLLLMFSQFQRRQQMMKHQTLVESGKRYIEHGNYPKNERGYLTLQVFWLPGQTEKIVFVS